MRRAVLGLLAAACVPLPFARSADEVDPKGAAFFEKKIRPVLVQHCYKCHAADSKKLGGGLRLDSRDGVLAGGESGPALVAGDPKKSLLFDALRHDGLKMPPDSKLPEAVVADFEKWIQMGAPDPRGGPSAPAASAAKKEIDWQTARDFWSFQPVRNPAPPAVHDGQWPRSDIDRFVLAELEAKGLRPVADADRVMLIRRLSFDLTGLPPSPEEVDRFVSDRSPDAVAALVDRLLDSPQFGERWGRHWLDVARYAESNGNVDNFLFPHAWRYRDYVIAAFNADKPFDRFLAEQIAGDLLPAETPRQKNEQRTATGFLALTSKPRPQNNPDYAMDLVSEQIEVATTAFLGLTVACARCHDHKFDPIPQREFYALAAIFESTEMLHGGGGRGNANAKQNVGRAGLHALEATDAAEADASARAAEELERARAEAADAKQAVAQFRADARDREENRRAAEEVSARPGNKQKQKAKPQAKRPQAKAGKAPPIDSILTAQERKELKTLEDRAARLEEAVAEREQAKPASGLAMGLADRPRPVEGRIRIRGESQKLGESVPRGFVTVATLGTPPVIDTAHSGRLELARWIASRDNPLTPRVAVNRVWRHLFGRGLVPTVDNFGALGETPSHPELLDHLATRFVDDGWSVKRLVRTIVLSRAYQLSSRPDAKALELDPDNTLLWRHTVRRLDGESIRDAMLAVSGDLDRNPPAGSPVSADGTNEIRNGLDRKFSQFEFAHRSVYLPIVRNAEPEFLTTFDLPDTELVVGDRSVTTVPAQSLFLLNSRWVVERSASFARRIQSEPSLRDAERIDLACRLAFGRKAAADERDRLLAYLETARAARPDDAWTLICQALLASSEFRYIE